VERQRKTSSLASRMRPWAWTRQAAADLSPVTRTKVSPREATEQELSGAATVLCKVADIGRLTDSAVVKEDPANVGFGEAAAREAEDLIVADTTQDTPGSWVFWSTRFTPAG